MSAAWNFFSAAVDSRSGELSPPRDRYTWPAVFASSGFTDLQIATS